MLIPNSRSSPLPSYFYSTHCSLVIAVCPSEFRLHFRILLDTKLRSEAGIKTIWYCLGHPWPHGFNASKFNIFYSDLSFDNLEVPGEMGCPCLFLIPKLLSCSSLWPPLPPPAPHPRLLCAVPWESLALPLRTFLFNHYPINVPTTSLRGNLNSEGFWEGGRGGRVSRPMAPSTFWDSIVLLV